MTHDGDMEMNTEGGRYPRLLEIATELKRQGTPPEEILISLRDEGSTIIESIKVMRELHGLSLGDAKDFVHVSRAWADRRELHDAVHERAIEAVADLASRVPPQTL
jgi:ribosomal protein L7/L12